MLPTTTIPTYLDKKWIFHYKTGKEIAAHCVFNECDKDSRGKEAHLYIEESTGLYQCKKCLAQWNWITLLKHFWDDPWEYPLEWYTNPKSPRNPEVQKKKITLTEKDISKYQKSLPPNIREYLNERGITEELIKERQIGYGSFYGSNWITIPIRDIKWVFQFFKLRRDPYWSEGNKYIFYPSWNETMLYGWENMQNNDDYIVICEWEFDQMILSREGLMWISSTGWVGTFKEEWLESLASLSKIYICFDNDDAWNKWATRLIDRLIARFPEKEIYRISLPLEMGKDVSDFIKNGGTSDEMMTLYSELIRGTDSSKFAPMTSVDIIRILSLTIKHDDTNKLIVFLAMLTAFTRDSQINIMLNAPSSSGKSYIPLQIAQLFPKDSLMELLYVSQSAFFHENGEYDKEKNEKHIHLDRKIIIFIDQPRTELLWKLRPLLSHDKPILTCKITDKSGQWWNQTKNIIIYGYPVAVFCTASTQLDEQEATRFLLISPETHSEKIYDTVQHKIRLSGADKKLKESIINDPERNILKERIQHIKDANIDDIDFLDPEKVDRFFLEWKWKQGCIPRDQRDIDRFMWFIRAFALLNLPHRKRTWATLYAEDTDIEEAWSLWQKISPGQKFNVSPYTMRLYMEILVPAYIEYNKQREDYFWPEDAIWVTRKKIIQKHSEVYGRPMSDALWRQEIEPTLANAGLITIENIWRNMHISPIADVWLT